jgi:hypothetical protein
MKASTDEHTTLAAAGPAAHLPEPARGHLAAAAELARPIGGVR